MSYYKWQFNEKTGVYYPLAVVVGDPITTKKVAERLAKISTVSLADVLAVLAEMPGVLADYMSQGKSVRLDGLGTFRYTLYSEGVTKVEDQNFQKQVKAVRVSFTPQREGSTAQNNITRALVPNDIEWIEWAGKDNDVSTGDGTGDGTGGDTGDGGDDGNFTE